MTQLTNVPELELQRIAAMNVAICLWNHVEDLPDAVWQTTRNANGFKNIEALVNQLTKHLLKSLPNSILELIVKYVQEVPRAAIEWISYHKQMIFFDIHDYHLICHFGHFVWHPDCTVDNVETARNIQNSVRLNELEKFRILCQYCLKDEIEQKWKLLLEKKTYDSVPFYEFPLLYYWNCYCRNRLKYVPVTKDLSINESMFRNTLVDNWPAKEYFFDRMNVDEQIQNAIWIIDSEFPTFQKNLIGKLNPAQRNTLYMIRTMAILKNYCDISGGSGHILQTWHETVEIITKDEFVELLEYFLMRKIDPSILTEVWISAPDAFKLFVLNSNRVMLIERVWNFWMEYCDRDLLKLVLNASTSIRERIVAMKIFNDHCERLLVENKLSTLLSVLTLCFSKSYELASAKRAFAKNDWFNEHCQNLIVGTKLSALKQLCDFFSDTIDANQLKSDLAKETFFNDHCKHLVKNGEIPELEKLLNFFFSNVEEAKQSVRDLFDTATFFSLRKNSTIKFKLSELDKILNFFGFDVKKSVQFKQSFVKKKFFADQCLESISRGEVSNLENFLRTLFPCTEEAVRFERSLKEKIISGRYCEKWLSRDELKKLKQLLKCFRFSDEEIACFRKNLCRELISNEEHSKLEIFFNSFLFAGLADEHEFKRNIMLEYGQTMIINHALKEFDALLHLLFNWYPFEHVETEFKKDMTRKKFFIDHCLELIKSDELLKLDLLLRYCLDEFYFEISRRMFKSNLPDDDTFGTHCRNLVDCGDFISLNKILSWTFSNEEKRYRFTRGFADFKTVKERCLGFLAAENLTEMNDLLNYFFPLDSELMLDYKRNLSLSEQGIEICLGLDRPKKILADMMGKKLSHDLLIDLKRKIIFSPVAISSLKNMTQKNQLKSIGKCFNQFLNSNKDKKLLKTRLLDNPSELITTWFFKSDQANCEFSIKWWLPDINAVREFKSRLDIDEVFEAGLKECLFQSFESSGQVSDGVLKEDLNLKSLDRFLSWYFESSKKVKEYKGRKIEAPEDMETIDFLLKNDTKISYFNELLNWVFEKDTLEILKFNKNRARKLRK